MTTPLLDVSIHFEPILDLEDRQVAARELLVRPVGGGQLLRRAERAGIDRAWITRLALSTAGTMLEHSSIPMHVNITPDDLARPAFADELLQTVPAASLRSLVLEITEDAPVLAGAPLDATLQSLRAEGVRFAIDDFGDGWASVESVEAVRPEVIKVRLPRLHRNGAPTALARQLHTISARWVALVVVEQIETPADLILAITLGFPLAQGWYWDEAGRVLKRSDAQVPPLPSGT